MEYVRNLAELLDIHPHVIWSVDYSIYNCSIRSIDEWESTGTKKPLQGLCTVVFGVLVILIYVITLIAMTDRTSLKHFCYQIMYFTSLFDITNLFCSNIVTGYYMVVGAVFCSSPGSIFFLGSIANGSWAGMSTSVVVLALGRLAEFLVSMSSFWMCVSVSVTIFFAFFTRPVLFNSTQGAWSFTPFIGDRDKEILKFRNILCFGVVVLTPLCITASYFILFVYVIIIKARFQSTIFTKQEKNIFLQCLIISLFLSVTCYLYMAVFLLEVPAFIKIMAQVGYQTTECAPLIGYLIFNPGIRRKVFNKLRGGSSTQVADVTNTSGTTPNS